MSSWSYEVRSVTLDSYDDVTTELQDKLVSISGEGLELVSCFPAPEHFSGELHQVPLPSEGSKPYDDVWNTPTGPTFTAVFKQQASE